MWPLDTAIIKLASLLSKIEVHGHSIMATRVSVTVEGLNKVHEEIFLQRFKRYTFMTCRHAAMSGTFCPILWEKM